MCSPVFFTASQTGTRSKQGKVICPDSQHVGGSGTRTQTFRLWVLRCSARPHMPSYQGQWSSEVKLSGKCKIGIIFWKVEVQLQPNLISYSVSGWGFVKLGLSYSNVSYYDWSFLQVTATLPGGSPKFTCCIFVSPELCSVRDHVWSLILYVLVCMYVPSVGVCMYVVCMWYFTNWSLYPHTLMYSHGTWKQWSLGRVTHVTSADLGSKVILGSMTFEVFFFFFFFFFLKGLLYPHTLLWCIFKSNITIIAKVCDRESRQDSWFDNCLVCDYILALLSSFPVPGGSDGPSGVLICSENYVTYKNLGDQPDIRMPIPRRRVRIFVNGTWYWWRKCWP